MFDVYSGEQNLMATALLDLKEIAFTMVEELLL